MKFQIENTLLTVDKKQVVFNGTVIPLSSRGHACLIEFLSAENRVLSKSYLMESLWANVVVSDDSLFKVIQEVRQALEKIGIDKGALKNVYGKGYQLELSAVVNEVEKTKLSKKHFSILFVGLLFGCTLTLIFWPKSTAFSDESFEAIVGDINSNYLNTSIDFDQLRKDYPQALDQLKLAYLQGLREYKSGGYDKSIALLTQGLKVYKNGVSNSVLADTYLLLCKMYIYRNDEDTLREYLAESKKHYAAIGDEKGLLQTKISYARYQQTVLKFEESIQTLNQVIEEAEQLDLPALKMRGYANLAYSYQQLGDQEEQLRVLEVTLDLALQQNHGAFVALAYGELSQIQMQQGNPIKAMKFAQQALYYVLAQKDTNIFQQGFSAFYNLLNELGHFESAEKYLADAINIQAKFNDELLVIAAELNLARVNVNVQQYEIAKRILLKLYASNLSDSELIETDTLMGLVSYYLKDNITAYTKSKEVFFNQDVLSNRIKAQAGIVLASASVELERYDEAAEVFAQVGGFIQPHWRFEYGQFLLLAQRYFERVEPNETQQGVFAQKYSDFLIDGQTISEQTQTPQKLTKSLDEYIVKISQ